ncbi:MAG: hypothetical protein PUF11_09540 [Parafannyhessea umbonata]|uniref:hypothetical protein n=1 Tax=Parafannyhessea umbonata TaxID=604330 RepID=UPI0026EE65B1|nr:hypothetical protein [Parafannyhessea umbonata]MDD6567008.1 hypothetical protein [Parafannyhessea umbonata]
MEPGLQRWHAATLWVLDKPMHGRRSKLSSYVLLSYSRIQYIPEPYGPFRDLVNETMAFVADEHGNVLDWTELGCIRDEDATDGSLLEELGCEVAR